MTHTKLTNAFDVINDWLNTNLLFINFSKTHYIQFATKNKPKTHITITHQNKQIITTPSTKFLGIYINDTMTWKNHIEYTLPKLSAACYAMRTIKQYMSLATLKKVHFANFNSIMNYGLPFWGTSPYSIKIFRMQKRIVRIMMSCSKMVSCRDLFRKLRILPLMSQYILTLIIFLIKNNSKFTVNSEIHNINTRQHTNFHYPITNLTGYQQGIYCSGVRVYNKLPLHIKQLSDDPKNFVIQLKKFLYHFSFYSLEEYF